MTHTPVTDRFVNNLSKMCKKAGYDIPTARQIKLKKAAELVEGAKMRVLAREFAKYAACNRKIRQIMKTKKKAKK